MVEGRSNVLYVGGLIDGAGIYIHTRKRALCFGDRVKSNGCNANYEEDCALKFICRHP